MKQIILKFIPVYIAIVVLIIVSNVGGNAVKERREAYSALSTDYNLVHGKVQTAKQKGIEAGKDTTVLQALDGDGARQRRDLIKLDEFYREIFTYSDGKSYDKIRETLVGYVGEDNAVVKSFFLENKWNEDRTKSTVDMLKSNMNYQKSTSYLTEMKDDVYKYMSVVSYSAVDFMQTSAEGKMLAFVSLDKDGKPVELDIYGLVK